MDHNSRNRFITFNNAILDTRANLSNFYPKVMKIPRLRKQGQHFLLSRVRKTDAGQYVCRVESEVPLELRHTLNVLYPARVSSASN